MSVNQICYHLIQIYIPFDYKLVINSKNNIKKKIVYSFYSQSINCKIAIVLENEIKRSINVFYEKIFEKI